LKKVSYKSLKVKFQDNDASSGKINNAPVSGFPHSMGHLVIQVAQLYIQIINQPISASPSAITT
jgi:hypothetical protein